MFLPLQILIIVIDDAIEELHSCLEVYSRNTSIILSVHNLCCLVNCTI